MDRTRRLLIIITAGALFFSCGKIDDSMQGISPDYVINQFFITWKKKDWKALYALSHPSIIQKIRMQALPPDEQSMKDEELFIRHFIRASKMHPGSELVSYAVKSISGYKPGDTTVWADTVVNGRKKRIPLTLDGLTLKIDLTRIE